ncbi:MAG: hypothetical protein LBT62_01155, partial [Deltaproteobacteria bacterium]|nr:hypothetical protein [Deltaproteobacteria bacterium]
MLSPTYAALLIHANPLNYAIPDLYTIPELRTFPSIRINHLIQHRNSHLNLPARLNRHSPLNLSP